MIRFEEDYPRSRIAQKVIMWSALVCPFWGLIQYRYLIYKIHKAIPHKPGPDTFNGRPGKQDGGQAKGTADIHDENLRQFGSPDLNVRWSYEYKAGSHGLPGARKREDLERAYTGIPLDKMRDLVDAAKFFSFKAKAKSAKVHDHSMSMSNIPDAHG